ncbi:stage II sporulation protein M [Natroniella sulfidigena]|uniref:stage II sporulation protein M n=1 Tax=Natroniella sulfidigena TaxID=723921 RepID=UPI00200A795D|nr:stage II sporulation protein M [Natroniella sulfidigena]MCK8816603.1 stage II sporulation protein M [Natroniella sulfidigena]
MINYRYLKKKIILFLEENLLLLFFIIVFFVIGVIFGTLAVRTLEYAQKEELVEYLGKFILEINQLVRNDRQLIAQNIVISNLRFVFLFWLLGLTVVGALLIPIIIFLRGFIVGFTVGFLLDQMFLRGIILAIISVVPQNIIFLPSLILGALVSISFALTLGKGILMGSRYKFRFLVTNYSIVMLMIGILLFTAGFVEAYITPTLIRLIADYIV